MKKLLVSVLSVLLLSPSLCMAEGKTKWICGEVKQTLKYKAPNKTIEYRYAIIEEDDDFDDGWDAYERKLPYGLYMFKIAPNVKKLHNCFEIDLQKQTIVRREAVG